jgi:hypothetical protein
MKAMRERARAQDVYAWLKGCFGATWGDDLTLAPVAPRPAQQPTPPPAEPTGAQLG